MIEWAVRKALAPVIRFRLCQVLCLYSRFPDRGEIPPQMPLTKTAGLVSLLLQHLRNREIIRLENRFTECADYSVKPPPVMLTCQKCKTTRGANSRGAVPISEPHPPGSKPVEMRRLNFRLRIAIGNVSHAHVIRVKYNNVRQLIRRRQQRTENGEDKCHEGSQGGILHNGLAGEQMSRSK